MGGRRVCSSGIRAAADPRDARRAGREETARGRCPEAATETRAGGGTVISETARCYDSYRTSRAHARRPPSGVGSAEPPRAVTWRAVVEPRRL